MNVTELIHLIARWLHVLTGVMFIGQLWSLTLVHRFTPDRPLGPISRSVALRGHAWLRWAAAATWLTGIVLLGIVYYGGGAVTGQEQSRGLAIGVGLATLFTGWLLYDVVWTVLRRRESVAFILSLALLAGVAALLERVMTGRAVFIHLGAMLGTIIVANEWQRIWPVESRRLRADAQEQPPADPARVAATRLRHNTSLSAAVVLLMVSNHFPLMYGQGLGWLVIPVIILLGWLMGKRFYAIPMSTGSGVLE